MRIPNLLGLVLKAKARRCYRRFEEASRHLRRTQERVLLEKIHRNRDSRFGRDHHFHDIHTVADFRRSFPVSDYGHFEPYIEQVKCGDARAMFGPDESVVMFALTSGTYSRPKYIPVTKAFLDEYKFGWHVWGDRLVKDYLPALDYAALHVVSPAAESYTEAGIPCGAISGLIAETMPWVIRQKYTPPLAVSMVKHPSSKYYLTGRIAVGRRVSYISTANPSSVLSVVRSLDENREKVIRDLHDGGVDDSWEIPDEVKRRLRWHLRPRRRRARRLEEIVERTGRLLPADYWGDLKILGNWKGGSCGVYLERYPEYFGELPVRDVGLMATEGRMTIPYSNEGASGPLDITSHFFEFIPEEESESESPTVLMAHELEADRNYFILLSTSSGLYRYSIQDCVRVTGFFHETPELAFLNKGQYFSSLTGEKVSEFQVVESLRQASLHLKCGAEDGIFSPMTGDPPGYSLALERRAVLEGGRRGEFLARFEQHLRSVNVEYASKRDSGRLAAPVLHLLPEGTFQRIKEERLTEMGGRREQYKHCFLVNTIDFHKELPVAESVALEA